MVAGKNTTNKCIGILVLLVGMSLQSSSQNYFLKHYDLEKGLGHNTVYSSVQSKDGFLWFGTKGGLNRFDGYNFKLYKYKSNDSNSLGDNLVRSLLEESDTVIWVGTNSGLYKFDRKKEVFTLIQNTDGLNITKIIKDLQGGIFIKTKNELMYIARNQNKASKVKFKSGVAISSIGNFQDKIIVCTESGEITEVKFSQKTYKVLYKFNTNFNISFLVPLKEDYIILSNKINEIYLINLKTKNGTLIVDKVQNIGIIRDLKIIDDDLWIASETGAFKYDLKKNELISVNEILYSGNLEDKAIYTILQDRQKNIWIGSYFKGIYCVIKGNNAVQNFIPSNITGSLKGRFVREIIEDNNHKLWIGTEDNGLFYFDPLSKKFDKIYLNGVNNIHGLYLDSNKLYIGTFFKGLYELNVETKKITNHQPVLQSNGNSGSFIDAIIKTSRNELLIGTDNGVYILKNGIESKFSHFPSSSHFICLFESSDKIIYGGTIRDGLYTYDVKNNKVRNFKQKPGLEGGSISTIVR